MNRFLWPLVGFAVLVGFLAVGLKLNPREVPSPFIGKPAPAFTAAVLGQPERQVTRDELLGKVWVLNVWASWCGPCRDEHPLWVQLAPTLGVPVVGLNYKDQTNTAQQWLKQLGDPYAMSLVDPKGRIGIDWGVYGVPETFVVDAQGIVRVKHVGPVTPEVMKTKIEPAIRAALGAAAGGKA